MQPPHNPNIALGSFRNGHNSASDQLRPNVPKIPRIEEQARRELAGYHALIENLDWNLGRIQKTLQRANLAFQTHIVFFSDQGDLHGSHGQFRITSPYEEALRIPFVINGEQQVALT